MTRLEGRDGDGKERGTRRGRGTATYCRVGTIPCTPGMISSLSPPGTATALPLSADAATSVPPFAAPLTATAVDPPCSCCCPPEGSEIAAPVEEAREVDAVGRTSPDMFETISREEGGEGSDGAGQGDAIEVSLEMSTEGARGKRRWAGGEEGGGSSEVETC